MASVTLKIPDDIEAKLGADREQIESTLRLSAAFSLCQRGEISTSQAAELAGLSYGDFLKSAADAKVSLFSISIEEISEELAHGFTMGR